jgi:LysR substrate binding domain
MHFKRASQSAWPVYAKSCPFLHAWRKSEAPCYPEASSLAFVNLSIGVGPRSSCCLDLGALHSTGPHGLAGRLVDGYIRHAHLRPKERFELDGLEAIAIMVDRGLGVSLVPDWSPPWPEGLSLRKLPVPDDRFTRYIGLLWNRASLRAGLVHAFLEVAEATLAPGLHGAKRPRSGFTRRR